MDEATLPLSETDSNHPPIKRMLSPNEWSNSHRVHKKHISEESFANDMAAMSLNSMEGNCERNSPIVPPISTPLPFPNVVRISDMDAFLADQELSDDDHDVNVENETNLVERNINGILLPMEHRPGERKLRIPDFVLQSSAKESSPSCRPDNTPTQWVSNDYYAVDWRDLQDQDFNTHTTQSPAEDAMEIDL